MELWDVYNEDRSLSGKIMTRGENMPKGGYHLVVHCTVFNRNGEMLIQQRQPFKNGWPNMWDITTGGSAVQGETSQMAIQRELYEEVGISYDFKNIRPRFTMNFDIGFDDHYIIQKDIDISTLHLQYEEVQRVKWATMDEILDKIDDGTFIPYHKSLIQMLFDLKNCYGCTKK